MADRLHYASYWTVTSCCGRSHYFRRMAAAAAGLAMFPGDPREVASVIIASADQSPAPKRLTLGSDGYPRRLFACRPPTRLFFIASLDLSVDGNYI